MAAYAAAAVGVASIVTSVVQNKKAKKTNQAQGQLTQMSQELFQETDPIRRQSINQAMTAMLTGKTGLAGDQITLAEHSAITGNQAKVKQQAERRLGREGLLNSSYGNAQLTNIDEATSQMLTGADTEELKRLTAYGESVGFQGVGAALAGTQSAAQMEQTAMLFQSLNAQKQGQAGGQLLGMGLGGLMNKKGSSGGTATGTSDLWESMIV